MDGRLQSLEVWGEYACFTNPITKAERFSYQCPTPSATRGIFDSIYVKPVEFRWQVRKIEILEPVQYIALRRNEVKEKISSNAAKGWMEGRGEPIPIMADADKSYWNNDQKGRTQRQTMALKNVRYRIHASVQPWRGFENQIQGLEGQFRRRAEHGKCVWQPFFGCREFPAYFRLIDASEPLSPAISLDIDMGWMLYDVFDLAQAGKNTDNPCISVFHAVVRKGVLAVPSYDSEDVKKGIKEVQNDISID